MFFVSLSLSLSSFYAIYLSLYCAIRQYCKFQTDFQEMTHMPLCFQSNPVYILLLVCYCVLYFFLFKASNSNRLVEGFNREIYAAGIHILKQLQTSKNSVVLL